MYPRLIFLALSGCCYLLQVLIADSQSTDALESIDTCLARFSDSDAEVRITALRQLQTSLDPRIPAAMFPLLSDQGNSIRRLAARAIGSRWWQISQEKRSDYIKALAQSAKSEFEDERNMADRAIGLLTGNYEGNMFARSANGRWVVYERRGLPCLVDTQTRTEELLGWPRDASAIEMLLSAGGNESLVHRAYGGDSVIWHPKAETVAFMIWQTRRASTVWIWQHKIGLHKLMRSELVKLLQPKGHIDEPNPLTAEIQEWKGDDLYVSVKWGREWGQNIAGSAVVAWNLSTHKWRMLSEEYHRGSEEN